MEEFFCQTLNSLNTFEPWLARSLHNSAELFFASTAPEKASLWLHSIFIDLLSIDVILPASMCSSYECMLKVAGTEFPYFCDLPIRRVVITMLSRNSNVMVTYETHGS